MSDDMTEAIEQAAIAIFEGDVDRLAVLCQATPAIATHTMSQGHPTMLQMVACEAQQLPDAVGTARVLVAAGAEASGPLVAAAGCNSAGVVSALLDLGTAVDGPHEWTALDEAIYWNNREIATLLIDKGANTRRLRRAAGLGDVAAIVSFFDGNAVVADAGPIASPFDDTVSPVEAIDHNHIVDHAFVMAVNAGEQPAAQLLLDSGARVNAAPPGYHWRGTALHAAVWRGEVALVQWLLDAGADPSIRDGLANADALGWATHHEHPALVGLLT